MSAKRNVSVCKGHESANALYFPTDILSFTGEPLPPHLVYAKRASVVNCLFR